MPKDKGITLSQLPAPLEISLQRLKIGKIYQQIIFVEGSGFTLHSNDGLSMQSNIIWIAPICCPGFLELKLCGGFFWCNCLEFSPKKETSRSVKIFSKRNIPLQKSPKYNFVKTNTPSGFYTKECCQSVFSSFKRLLCPQGS